MSSGVGSSTATQPAIVQSGLYAFTRSSAHGHTRSQHALDRPGACQARQRGCGRRRKIPRRMTALTRTGGLETRGAGWGDSGCPDFRAQRRAVRTTGVGLLLADCMADSQACRNARFAYARRGPERSSGRLSPARARCSLNSGRSYALRRSVCWRSRSASMSAGPAWSPWKISRARPRGRAASVARPSSIRARP